MGLVISPAGTSAFLTATSSVLTPISTDSNKYLAMTGNSVPLTPGSWLLSGAMNMSINGAVTYSEIAVGWFGAQGTGTTTPPTALGSLDTGNPLADFSCSSGVNFPFAPVIRITVTTNTSVFLVGTATMTTPANARWTAYIYAQKIGVG